LNPSRDIIGFSLNKFNIYIETELLKLNLRQRTVSLAKMTTPPPPSTASLEVDTLPVLYALLSRLQTPTSSGPAGSPPAATPSTHTTTLDPTAPLRVKDIPIATDGIKHKLQKARKEVKGLPDMERTIAEQEEEIRELEEKIRQQREVFRGLADVGSAVRLERG
jgi:RNA polymerase II transcription mediator complex subunit 9